MKVAYGILDKASKYIERFLSFTPSWELHHIAMAFQNVSSEKKGEKAEPEQKDEEANFGEGFLAAVEERSLFETIEVTFIFSFFLSPSLELV